MDWSSCTTDKTANGAATLDCIPPLIADIVWWMLIFTTLAAVFFIIVSGYKYITSHGDPKKFDEARRTLVFSIIGLMLAFISFFLVNLVAGITGVGCLDAQNLVSFTACK